MADRVSDQRETGHGRRAGESRNRVRCRWCGSQNTEVLRVRSRDHDGAVIRRRVCLDCGGRSTSEEQTIGLLVAERLGKLAGPTLAVVERLLEAGVAVIPLEDGGAQLEWRTAEVEIILQVADDGRPIFLAASRMSDGSDLTE